jgi:hypothetical protein
MGFGGFGPELAVQIVLDGLAHGPAVHGGRLDAAGFEGVRGLGPDASGDEHLGSGVSHGLGGLDARSLGQVGVGGVVQVGVFAAAGVVDEDVGGSSEAQGHGPVGRGLLGCDGDFHDDLLVVLDRSPKRPDDF